MTDSAAVVWEVPSPLQCSPLGLNLEGESAWVIRLCFVLLVLINLLYMNGVLCSLENNV